MTEHECAPLDGAREIASALRERIALGPVRGTMRMYGQWFGGKPMDNLHTVVAVEAVARALIVDFDLRERLVVVSPCGGTTTRGWEAGLPVAGLAIATADSVTWSYYSYTHPQAFTADLFREQRHTPRAGHLAAELLAYAPRSVTPSESAAP